MLPHHCAHGGAPAPAPLPLLAAAAAARTRRALAWRFSQARLASRNTSCAHAGRHAAPKHAQLWHLENAKARRA